MVKTGYISFISEVANASDTDGNPVPATKTSTAYIKCNLATVTKEYKILIQGQYQQANYSCYIDSDKVSSLNIDLPTITEVQIQDNHANNLGIFQVQNVEYLDLTKRVKLIV